MSLGGIVLFGAALDSSMVGQLVGEDTLRDFSQILRRIESPAAARIDRVELSRGHSEVLALPVSPDDDCRVFTFDGRVFQGVGSTTQIMPQETYERLLMDRTHSDKRWEHSLSPIHLRDRDLRTIVRIGIDQDKFHQPHPRNPATS